MERFIIIVDIFDSQHLYHWLFTNQGEKIVVEYFVLYKYPQLVTHLLHKLSDLMH